MKILVTVKQVPDTSGKVAVNPDGTLDRASMQTIINPDDLNAVEAALSLKDQLGCPVIAVSMGPPPAAGMLLELKEYSPMLHSMLKSAELSFEADDKVVLTMEDIPLYHQKSGELLQILDKIVCER